jgi:hypothetical protein
MKRCNYIKSVDKWERIVDVLKRTNDEMLRFNGLMIYGESSVIVSGQCGFCYDFFNDEEGSCKLCPLFIEKMCANSKGDSFFWNFVRELEEGRWGKALVMAEKILSRIKIEPITD